MITFLSTYWLLIVLVIIIALVCISIMGVQIQKFGLKETILEAILKAEEQYNTTTGKERLEIAIEYVYETLKLPSWLKLILPESLVKSQLEKWIQEIFDEVKKLLDYQKGDDI